MEITVTKEICGAQLKRGQCDKSPFHKGNHSSPEQRQYQKEATQRTRDKQRTREKQLVESPELVEPEPEEKEPGAQTEQECWDSNIRKLEKQNPELLARHKEQRELVLDQMHWMRHGHTWDSNDVDYVDLEEGFADLEEFVTKHGLCHIGISVGKEGQVEKQLVGKELWKAEYWKFPKAMRALSAASKATAIYMRTGILTAVPDWYYHQFKNRVNRFGAIGIPSDFPKFQLDRERWLSGKDWDLP